ncbi:transcriptional elongation factor [Grosmannia clavigera kw1407]|uniref:Transcriptional elongation factor n=1 Tax=Grosmannia clavigera (strain kw1407 / UAMH 11150) TaxID=655863 RepID=F0XBV4_GROCL|nr:transcriptional elongation factor [Grosmannia clavigera kw1407]EFX04949.1 transcriptional elongation factor [Grosmannia clavigera kw1407]
MADTEPVRSPLSTPDAEAGEHGSPELAPPTSNKAASDREEGEEVEGEDDNSKSRPKADDNDEGGDGDGNSEDDLLSDVDEDQFEDYDPATAYIEERPITIDEEAARGLKSAKRKRSAGDGKAQKAREARRDKKRRPVAGKEEEEGDVAPGITKSDGPKRSRRPHGGENVARRKKSQSPEVNEEDLSPEERRKRALDRAINLAIRNPNKRRRKQDEEDLEQAADEEIAQLKIRMEKACMADIDARAEGKPAVSKLQLLPQVMSVLNRNDIQETVLDPETNFLQSVKFFLEPLNDGSLPSYTIQRDIFTCLTKLPIEKDALLSSGIGKVVLFYTRSKRAEPTIKRMAERLVGEWSRPILKKTDDFKKRYVETRDYDYRAAKIAEQGTQSQYTLTERPISRFELDKELQLAPPVVNPNRAQPVGLPQSYTIAPKSTFDGNRTGGEFRPIGASSMEAFRRMTQKAKQRNKKK